MFVWISSGPSSSYRVSNELEKLKDHLTKKYSLKDVDVRFHEELFQSTRERKIEVGMLGENIAHVIGYIYEVEEL